MNIEPVPGRGMGFRSAVVVAACLSAALAGPATAAPTPAPSNYVALGDSFAAGVGIAPQVATGNPATCGRSMINYPHLVAEAIDAAAFRDVTCGGATTANLAGRQADLGGGSVAPQFDALDADTTLVTLGIGGNDIALPQLGARCINPLPEPWGHSCARENTAGGRDVIGEQIQALATTYGVVVEEIRRRAPRAAIYLIGYPQGIRAGGCPGIQPARADDADYLQAKIDQLNTVMRDQATEHGATYIDLDASTRGHDACAAPGQNWITGVAPAVGAPVPMHPNAAGHVNVAHQIVEVLSR